MSTGPVEFHVLIPARLESTRLPDKALADVAGRPLVVRVMERAMAAAGSRVHVATDSPAIAEAVAGAGGTPVLTGAEHESGTSRLAEAVDALGLDDSALVVNLQGDEPLMPPACIRRVAALLVEQPDCRMGTLYAPLESEDQWRDPGVVKLVPDSRGRALYFSRAPVPHVRDGGWPEGAVFRHLGLYAYRAGALRQWRSLPDSPLEALERLEQLRPLAAGWKIACSPAPEEVPPGVDTTRDLEAVRAVFAAGEQSGRSTN